MLTNPPVPTTRCPFSYQETGLHLKELGRRILRLCISSQMRQSSRQAAIALCSLLLSDTSPGRGKRFATDSLDFATRMLEEAGVAATPGVDFDPVHGREYVRFCYAGSAADMREAVARIGRWLKR